MAFSKAFADYLSRKDAVRSARESPPRSPTADLAVSERQPDGPSQIRFREQTVRTWARETFESEQMQSLMADFAAHLGVAPDDAGGADYVYLVFSVIQDEKNRAVKGGMGRLPATRPCRSTKATARHRDPDPA